METIYVANLKASERFGNGILKGSICIDEFLEILEKEDVKKLIYDYHGKKFINIQVVERKEPNQFKKTHYMKIDEFVPDSSKRKASKSEKQPEEKKPRTRRKATAK